MPQVALAFKPADLRPREHVRSLLFDWDGTLFDNHGFNFRALRHALLLHNIAITEDWFHAHSGFSARGIVEEAARIAGSGADAGTVLGDRDAYAEDRLHEIAPVEPVLAVLLDAGDRKVGVVTGSNRSNIEGLLRLHGLEERLDTIVTRDDLQHGKPDPEGYLLAMRHLGVDNGNHVLVYEDSDQGIRAALQAGADVIDVRPLLNTQAPA
ncbi:HAD family hydrolase [Ruania alba]|uniref:Beta-phosphoglucomutase n=1 Tax=Ruania alba TaxID=648782 RepID=A0A1H5EN27_9MICO|nr:HAD family phosphatase [Ruania alba]SED92489.1 beta-phosphoglucomutase [Ruania alba]